MERLLTPIEEREIRQFSGFLKNKVVGVDDLFPPPPDNVRELVPRRPPSLPPAETRLGQVALLSPQIIKSELVLA